MSDENAACNWRPTAPRQWSLLDCWQAVSAWSRGASRDVIDDVTSNVIAFVLDDDDGVSRACPGFPLGEEGGHQVPRHIIVVSNFPTDNKTR